MTFHFHTLSLMSGPEMDSQLPKTSPEEEKTQSDKGTGSQSEPKTLPEIPPDNAYGKNYLFYT